MTAKYPFLVTWKNAVRNNRELSSKAKLVLLVLADRVAPGRRSCSLSIPELETDCSLSRSSTRRGLHEAKERGFLGIRACTKQGARVANRYELRLPTERNPWEAFVERLEKQ